MKLKYSALALSLILSISSVYALDEPVGSRFDSRIKTIIYNEEDVTKIDSMLGVQTHLILDPKETFITYAFGDSDAWTFGHKENHYFIKPKAENGDTNLTIVTNKRSYNFDIRYHSIEYLKVAKAKRNFDSSMTFQVQFKYPEVEAAKQKVAADEEKRKQIFNQLLAKGVNTKYSTNGNKAVLPLNVWDSQGFTYFKFAVGQDIPNIYKFDATGTERTLMRHMEGQYKEIVVMHGISKEWHLRLGTVVGGVFNDNDGSQPVYPSSTGTVSDKLKRVIINEQ